MFRRSLDFLLELVDEFYTDVAQRLRHVEAPRVKLQKRLSMGWTNWACP